jgi:hypothetical protein
MALTVNGLELPTHISYSAMTTFLECGHKYFLTRVAKVEEHPGWWQVGGNAVHKASEVWDMAVLLGQEEALTVDSLWNTHWEAERTLVASFTTIPESEWRSGGRATKEFPNKENPDWWHKNGPKMIEAWIKWRSNGWNILELQNDDGFSQYGIELGINTVLGGAETKMFIDRVMVTPEGEVIIVDLKTGARTPTSDLQLAFYAAGVEKVFGIRPKWGAYWMARQETTSGLVDLDLMPTENVERMIKMFDTARIAGILLPNFSNCNYCSVINHCEWKGNK